MSYELQTELSDTAELLAASTEARLMMADTIADLRTENATLRETVNAAHNILRAGQARWGLT
ncbi:MAG: hypothetical protein LC131_02015 [Anaerolineae bacterium]|nr:hypothetical protein [Anaerolineae bacterium]